MVCKVTALYLSRVTRAETLSDELTREYYKAESPVKLYFHTPLNKRLFPRESPRKDGVFLGLRPPLITEKQPPCWVVNVLNVGLKRIVPFPMFCNVQN
jgi:hypothetical protein